MLFFLYTHIKREKNLARKVARQNYLNENYQDKLEPVQSIFGHLHGIKWNICFQGATDITHAGATMALLQKKHM